ncbi:MAG: DUF368 domain-containing protein [Flavobacteriales bacterium]|nr:DUF368 domain-containing protein [Flavobacteriales bacterium]
MRTTKDYLLLTLKGMAMGAADVVPGVSGGTIAFISGIYEELITTISGVNLGLLKTLRNEGIAAAWKALNGNFIVALFLGIAISIVSLAKVISFLLDNEPVLLWSFFFGLVLASVIYVGKQVKQWSVAPVIALVIGSVIAYYITILPPLAQSDSTFYVFISGMIAICAMILPGISGSFILLILGSYQTILGAVKDKEIVTIATFMGGCVVGLLAFSKVLKWTFAKFHDITVALLTGFLVGSLNKIWPWKKIDSFRMNSHGEWVTFLDHNVLPENYDVPVLNSISEAGIPSVYQNADSQIFVALLFSLLGFALIFGMEALANKLKK